MDPNIWTLMTNIGHTPLETISWLQAERLLAREMICYQHDNPVQMRMAPVDLSDGYKWRCPQCKKRASIRTGSFYEEFKHIELRKLVAIIYSWAKRTKQSTIAQTWGVSERAVCQIASRLREICAEDLRRHPVTPFGGPAVVCQLDESKFNKKPKYQRGRRPAHENWVFGIITTQYTPARGYFEVVPHRDAATLFPIIQRVLQPRSIVHSDDWGAYRRLQARLPVHVATHNIVVHRYNFIDPVTGAHTQHIESCWNRLKTAIKERKGVRRNHLPAFLQEQMWRDWKAPGGRRVFLQFNAVLRDQYDV